MFFSEGAGSTGLEASETGFLRPDAKQAEIDGLAGVDPFLFGGQFLVAMADLVGGAVGVTDGVGTVRRNLSEIVFVVDDERGVILAINRNAVGRLLVGGGMV